MSQVAIQRASTPTALTHSLLDYMNELYDKVACRAFSIFEHNGHTHGHDLENWLKAESEFLTPVPVELSETETEYSVRAEVPGFTEKELEIVLDPGRVYITGKSEKKTEEKKKKTVYSEISQNEIFRSFCLPAEIDADKAKAVLNNGVLEITMPKAQPAKKVAIMAKAA